MSKRMGNALDQITCLSGAFGAFRRQALDDVASFDVGGGEDLDATYTPSQSGLAGRLRGKCDMLHGRT
jgi:hypothetical protein